MKRMVRECSCGGLGRRDHHLLDLLDAARHRRELDEAGLGGLGNDLGQRGLAHARRTPEDHRAGVVALDLHAQRLAGTDQVLLPEQLVQAARPHPLRQRSHSACERTSRRAQWLVRARCRTSSSPGSSMVRRSAATRRPLPRRLIQQHAGRDGRIQALHRAGAGNRDFARRPSRPTRPGTPLPSLPMTSATGPAKSDQIGGLRAAHSGGKNPHAGLAQLFESTLFRSPQAAARGRRCPPMRAPPSDSTRSRFPAGSRRPSRRMPPPSAESCPDCRDPECPPAQRTSAAPFRPARRDMCPRPLRRLNQRGNRLRRFGGQRRVEQLPRQPQNLSLRRHGQLVQQLLRTLRHKNRLHAQARAQRLFEQIRSFDAHARLSPAARRGQRLPQLLQARILLAFHHANRHRSIASELLCRFYGVLAVANTQAPSSKLAPRLVL